VSIDRQRLRDVAAVLLLLAATVPIAVLARQIAYDDSWITYRYAWNLAAGNGFVYNVGERFLGTSAPGYAALLALPGLISLDLIPTASTIICGLSLVAVGLGLYAFGRSHDDWLGGLVAGLLFVTNPVPIEAFGGEMVPQLALIIWAFVAQARRHWMAAVMLAVAATILRPDGVVPLGLVGLHQVWLRRQLPWREMAAAAVALGLWYGALWIYFGAPLPQTVGAKTAQRLSGIWRPLGMDLVDWFKALTIWQGSLFGSRTAPGFTTAVWLALFGLPAMLWRRHWWLVMAWPVGYMLAYRQLHLPFYHWYAVTPLLAIVVSAGAFVGAAGAIVTWMVRRSRATPATDGSSRESGADTPQLVVGGLFTLAILVFVALPVARFSLSVARGYPQPVERAYADLGRWFQSRTPAGASIGYLEIGILGYHAQRTLIDPLGLVNPDVAPHVAQRDFLWAYRHYRPDYIVYNRAFFPPYLGILIDQAWFKTEYVHVADLESGRGADIPLSIYRRASTTPAPR
jgi:hypothetical protein